MGSILFSFSPLNSHSNTFFVLAQLFVDDNCFIVVIFYWHKSGISRKKKKSLRSPFFFGDLHTHFKFARSAFSTHINLKCFVINPFTEYDNI